MTLINFLKYLYIILSTPLWHWPSLLRMPGYLRDFPWEVRRIRGSHLGRILIQGDTNTFVHSSFLMHGTFGECYLQLRLAALGVCRRYPLQEDTAILWEITLLEEENPEEEAEDEH